MTSLSGKSLIGYQSGQHETEPSYGINPGSGEQLQPSYYSASNEEVEKAVVLAHQAFQTYRKKSGKEKAHFLNTIANKIEAIKSHLVERTPQETALPAARVEMETGRTCGQLRLFANLVEEGSWLDARIDTAIPDRQPMPKPDLRSIEQAMGPVVVFCASNFPLAFSVAGGDTASALAAGCPVIVKAHHAHPATAELVGQAVVEAAKECNMPEGVFSLLYGSGRSVGMSLVKHPLIKAVGFTGSQAGGRALMDAAAARSEPIPVYAEMSSINPVFILPQAMQERGEEIATALHGSVNMGVGQFCTSPGIVLMNNDAQAQRFGDKLGGLMSESPTATMLTGGIQNAYQESINNRVNNQNVTTLANVGVQTEDDNAQAGNALFSTNANAFINDNQLMEEVFGPSALIITHDNKEQMFEVARNLEGQLTATIHGTEQDITSHQDLVEILETRVGRIIYNGYPTGVEVCHAMVHGGPYPATSDGRSTSVGSGAINRFTRTVSYQNSPDFALPDELKEANPLNIWRLVNGEQIK